MADVNPLAVLSLSPIATEAALWSLLPATALFLATLGLRGKARNLLLCLVVLLALANVLLGMAQMSGIGNEALACWTAPVLVCRVGAQNQGFPDDFRESRMTKIQQGVGSLA